MRSGELLFRQLVDPESQTFCEAPVVDEHDRRPVSADEVEDRGVDRGPDRAARLFHSGSHLDAGDGVACPRNRTRGRVLGEPGGSPASTDTWPSSRMSSTGTTTSRSSSFRTPASTNSISRPEPATKRPISSSGRWVAERPTRWNGASTRRSRRSRLRARWAPRFVPATACTSSRMTVSMPRRVSRACEVRSRKSDSGVVIRMSGGVRSIRRRSSAGVSPVRTPTESVEPSPASGLRRLRSMS